VTSNTGLLESASTFELPRAPGLRDEVVLAIEKAVLVGALSPGERLVEINIARQMGISKAPVREALRELERLGLVVSYPRRGTFVAEINPAVASEVYSFRSVIESYAARLAVSQVGDRDLAAMESLLEQADAEDPLSEAGQIRKAELDLAFHDEIYRLSGHRLLQDAWGNLRARIRVLLVVSGMLRTTVDPSVAGPRPYHRWHAAVMEALRARDADQAEIEVIRHLAGGERGLVRQLGGDVAGLRVIAEALARRPDLAVHVGRVPVTDRVAAHGST
jgi:DNA-binding GntR family transcriptional regulator